MKQLGALLKTYHQEFLIEGRSTHEVFNLNSDLAAVRRTVVRQAAGDDAVPEWLLGTSIVELVLKQKDVQDYINGGAAEALPYQWVDPKVIEEGRKWGYTFIEEKLYKDKQSLIDYCVEAGDKAIDHLYRIDRSSHMIFRPDERPVPLAIIFDYIQGRIYENEYDLNKVAVLLLQRDDVVVLNKNRKNNQNKWDHPSMWAKTPKDAIMDIPYYNSEDGQTQSVEFIWQPAEEDYQRLWDLAKDNPYPSTTFKQSVMSLDLFQLEEMASLKQAYHTSNKSIKL